MSFTLLGLLVAGLAVAVLVVRARRAELARLREGLAERAKARERGSDRARLQYPQIDLASCIGCGSCVRACPEEGVLDLVHGQAVVVHGARCVGHGRCAAECPTGAIAVTLGDLAQRRDIPALSERFESTRVEGLFLAGEVTGFALVRTAIAHGVAVADEARRRSTARRGEVAARARSASRGGTLVLDLEPDALDLVIVGAGPAGLACALRAKELGLSFVVLEQDEIGGTIAKYPRQKLVMTQPVALPLAGKLARTSYAKEELVEMWLGLVRDHALPVRTGEVFERVEPLEDGRLRVHTKAARFDATSVCLALGRRGTPRKLGVPGEDLAKVAYSLLDAHGYQGRRVLVVGGGDSAIEAALGLAEQPGNVVHLSYRKPAFTRLKARNEARLVAAERDGSIQVLYESEVIAIERERVQIAQRGAAIALANDDVFVFAGGTPPTELLEASGISFDPAERPAPAALADEGAGLLPALLVAFALALGAVALVVVYRDYYELDLHGRVAHPLHAMLAPSRGLGLACGVAASAAVLANLCYLARRSGRFEWIGGSLRAWMTAHVATGVLALVLALLHTAMAPKSTVGGHAFAALAVLVVTGAIGRWFYAFVPRAANGRELALDEVRAELARVSGEWDTSRGSFGEALRAAVALSTTEERWHGSFLARVRRLATSRRALESVLDTLRVRGEQEGVAKEHLDRMFELARRAQRTAWTATHYEDLRGLLATWRWIHRWVALAMVLLVLLHVWSALRYGNVLR